jgi:hypothetical protein
MFNRDLTHSGNIPEGAQDVPKSLSPFVSLSPFSNKEAIKHYKPSHVYINVSNYSLWISSPGHGHINRGANIHLNIIQSVIKNPWAWISTLGRGCPLKSNILFSMDVHAQGFFIAY